MSDIDYVSIMPELARKLWGPENPKLTKPKELWWGDRGSRKVNIEEGTWYDFRQEVGGGVLDFVWENYGTPREDKGAAIEWLRAEGFPVPESTKGKKSSTKQAPQAHEITATFRYVDEKGLEVYQVVRMEDGTTDPKTGKKNKTFRQRYNDPTHPQAKKNGWVWSLKDRRRVLYRLPQVLAAIKAGKRIDFFEGEKAVENAVEHLGLEATCNGMGAGKWVDDYTESLRDADLLLVPDLDAEGLNHVDVVASAAITVARRVRVLKIPGLTEKEDIYEWIHKHGGTREKFEQLVEQYAVVWMPHAPQSMFGAVTMANLDAPGPEHEWRIKGILAKRGLAVMAGPSKAGKSFAATDMAFAIARGTRYQGRKVEQGIVLYQAGEGGLGLKKRMRAYRQDKFADGEDPDTIPFVLLPGRFDLHTSEEAVANFIAEGLAWKAYYRMEIGMVVIDTLATATTGMNENDSGEVGKVLDKAQKIAEGLDTVVMVVHHMNKGGEQIRGSSAIMANVENTFIVSQLDITDSNQRLVRKLAVLKNKDGEDGENWQFVIRQVELGFDEEGIAVTSCVVDPPASGQVVDTTGLRLNDSELVVYDAITRALEDHGDEPRKSPNIPPAIKRVVKYTHIQELLERTWPYTPTLTDSPEEQVRKRRDAVRKVMERIGKRLAGSKIIGADYQAGLMWLTGAPIIGRTARRKHAHTGRNQEPSVAELEAKRQETKDRMAETGDIDDLGWT